jgi:uncharacterized protein YqgQ
MSAIDKILGADGFNQGQEFECILSHQEGRPLFVDTFMNVLRSSVHNAKTENIPIRRDHSLDISYRLSDSGIDSLRLTVHGSVAIDSIVSTFYHMETANMFGILSGRVLKDDGNSTDVPPTPKAIVKEKERHRLDSWEDTELQVRYRLSTEQKASRDLMKKFMQPSDIDSRNITIRFKDRVSIFLFDDKLCTVRLDMTSVKMGTTLQKVFRNVTQYEVEVDITMKKNGVPTPAAIDMFHATVNRVLGWIQGSSHTVMTRTEKLGILDAYFNNISGSSSSFYQMKAISMDIQRFTELLPHNYAVTDKADGETCQLILYDGKAYLLNNNLQICAADLPEFTSSSFIKDGITIAEGELIKIQEGKQFLLLYDLLFLGGQDKRCLSLPMRINALDSVLKESSPASLCPSEPSEFSNYLSKLMKSSERNLYIGKKLHLLPTGEKKEDIYGLAIKVWSDMKGLPYARDGLIFTGIDQEYTTLLKNQAYPILKWKPAEHNSIDVYIEFIKRPDGSPDILFDRTLGFVPKDRPYITAQLFVSRRQGGREYPVPFLEKEGKDKMYLFVDNDSSIPMDKNGYPVQDGTVVEVVYDMINTDAPSSTRWSVIRTRHDKTLSVRDSKTKYGNNEQVALSVWQTIQRPVTIDDFTNIVGQSYDTYSPALRARVGVQSVSKIPLNSSAYYQLQTDIASSMRKFHNYVKSILLTIYASPRKTAGTTTPKKSSVLDLGVGRGGDIMKYYHAKVKDVVGIDPDDAGLFQSADSAKQRYSEARKKHQGFPVMTFLRADASVPFNVQEQQDHFETQFDKNTISAWKRYFSPKCKYDVICIQFMIHYLMTTPKFQGLIENINNYLAPEGVVIITTFDARKVIGYLDGKKEQTTSYTDADGSEKVLFVIRDISVNSSTPSLNQAIDFHTTLYMEEGVFHTEYLVYPEILQKELKSRCGLHLIDSLSFSEIRDMTKTYGGVVFFNDQSPVEVASSELSDMYRTYVFQKMGNTHSTDEE